MDEFSYSKDERIEIYGWATDPDFSANIPLMIADSDDEGYLDGNSFIDANSDVDFPDRDETNVNLRP